MAVERKCCIPIVFQRNGARECAAQDVLQQIENQQGRAAAMIIPCHIGFAMETGNVNFHHAMKRNMGEFGKWITFQI